MNEPRTKNVLVTGSSNGIGRLAAIALAERGYRVWASMRDPAGRNETTRRELETMYRSHSAPNPRDVADAIVGVVESPAGRRPLRSVVGTDFGVRQINAVVEPLQRRLVETIGLSDLLNGPLQRAAARAR